MSVTRYKYGSPDEVVGVGATVATDSFYLGDGDSSCWAVIFEDGKFVQVHTGYTYADAKIDASPEIAEMWQAYCEADATYRREQAEIARREREVLEAQWEAATPRKGKVVEVVRGRKVAKGTKGTVIWYGEGNWGWRVGFIPTGETEPVWTAASNVEVIAQSEAGLAS